MEIPHTLVLLARIQEAHMDHKTAEAIDEHMGLNEDLAELRDPHSLRSKEPLLVLPHAVTDIKPPREQGKRRR